MSRKNRRTSSVPEVPVMDTPVDYTVYGADEIEPGAIEQMNNACRLPISVRGALLPDTHTGYGIPIGGVLATRGAVIPYGVGVDIACRMKLSIIAEPVSLLSGSRDRLGKKMQEETRFGMAAEFDNQSRRSHDVMDDEDWNALPLLRGLKDRAWSQLASSGGGNHFCEWCELSLNKSVLGIDPGKYIALLTHSGSRGLGHKVAKHYTDLAIEGCPLPSELKHLAWLSLASDLGKEYWLAMNLAGQYAQANHDLIHKHVLKAVGFKAVAEVDNHHNFAWLEEHDGEQLVVHRKGATPAGEGVLGIIPGSMGDPGFLVRGLGNEASLNSASHGAGRRLGRRVARETLTQSEVNKYLADRGITLLSGGLDEAPMAYKNIHDVMAAQKDLVEPLAMFSPKIVLMSPDKERER